MSLRVVLRQIQDPVKVTFFLHHVWAKSLDCTVLQGSSGANQLAGLASTPARHLVKVADVVRKANIMQHGHQCTCICGSMKAYTSESASSINDEQRQSQVRIVPDMAVNRKNTARVCSAFQV
jgi:hypothetical protein